MEIYNFKSYKMMTIATFGGKSLPAWEQCFSPSAYYFLPIVLMQVYVSFICPKNLIPEHDRLVYMFSNRVLSDFYVPECYLWFAPDCEPSVFTFMKMCLYYWFVAWCGNKHLILNVNKTKEMIVNFRNKWNSIFIMVEEVEVVEEYRYLDFHLDHRQDWRCNTYTVYQKGQSRV